jgi:hypothetical protein
MRLLFFFIEAGKLKLYLQGQLYTCWDKLNIAKNENEFYYGGNSQ